mgnify:CR=1 FL=1
MRNLRAVFMCAALGSYALGCGGDETNLVAPTDYNDPETCNPLGTVNCLMPWPSAVYLDEDSSTATGYRLTIPEGAMPINIDETVADPAPFALFDGFAPSGVIIAGFETGASAAGLPGPDDIGASLESTSPIILLNMDTGERVPFFAEVDLNTEKAAEQSLLIRPMERMKPGTRHLVAIRNTVKAADGSDLVRPAGFEALVQDEKYNHPLFSKIEPRYEDIFGALDGIGVSRDELVLAWDFVTASDDMLTRDLLTMRDAALPEMGEAGANLTFDIEQVAAGTSKIHKSFVGTHTSPSFLTNGEADHSRLSRDADGTPQLTGTFDAPFGLLIPKCAETAPLPLPVMVFGHGIFGSGADYLDDNLMQDVAQDYCFIVAAGDFIGLSERQIALSAFASNDVNMVWDLTEKLGQSVINFIALEHLVRGPLLNDPRIAIDGTPLIDPNQVYYFGGSLGGIMGNVIMAYDPVMPRGALGVPGGAWSILFERSLAWTPLKVAMMGSYEDQYIYQTLVAMFGMAFEAYDPITTAARVIHDPLPGTPAKQMFLYETMDDSLVANVSTELVSRSMNVKVVGPSLRVPYGMEVADGPLRSGFSIYDEHATPVPPPGNQQPTGDNGTHSGIHERDAVLRQVSGFLLNGEVTNECKIDGLAAICDCGTGACD